jgi:PIN domain nuclease of toxin-antitoxin system
MARAAEPALVHLDTHVVCWLYEGRTEKLSASEKDAIEQARVLVSPIVDLELALLREIGRIVQGPDAILAALGREIALEIDPLAFSRVVAAARDVSWTRDPFDRIIVAQATLAGARLVTKDRLIRKHFPSVLG